MYLIERKGQIRKVVSWKGTKELTQKRKEIESQNVKILTSRYKLLGHSLISENNSLLPQY